MDRDPAQHWAMGKSKSSTCTLDTLEETTLTVVAFRFYWFK